MENIHALLADNQSFTRSGIIQVLSTYFGYKIQITAVKDKAVLFESLLRLQPNILIIDYYLFDFNIIKELEEIKKIAPYTGILVVSGNQTSEDTLKVIDCGINNYIMKSCDEHELIEAFKATLNSKKYFSSEVLDILLEKKDYRRKSRVVHDRITSAELEIVKLITRGMTTKEIARWKNLSLHTVITHRKNIFRKLGINSTSELIIYAMKTGIVDSTEYYI